MSCSKCDRQATRRGMCNRCYERTRYRQKGYGRWQSSRVDAQPVRDHIRALNAAGLGNRRITAMTGISRTTLTAMLTGRPCRGTGPSKTVYEDTARKILAVPIPTGLELLGGAVRIDGTGTTRRLQALVAIGHSQHDVCQRLGWSDTNGSRLFIGSQKRVHVSTARKVAAIYDVMAMTPGTSQRARTHARQRGWAPPLAWDDDLIDNPAATPDVGAREKVSFADRYLELRDLGYRHTQIADRFGIKPESLNRQLERYGVTA